MFDMMKMMGKLKDVQENMKKAQEGLKDIKATGDAGAGMVTATVNGLKELIDLSMDESLINKDDTQMLKDLIIAAVNKAISNVEVQSREHMKKATDGMIPNIPGFDINSML